LFTIINREVDMKKYIILMMALLLTEVTACSGARTSVTTTSSTSATVPPPQAPIEVVSVAGPMPPINPGGPTVELVLKNTSATPVAGLTATLGVNGAPPGHDFTFSFGVNEQNPLPPGGTASARMTLIGGGFSSDILYPLTISGSFDGNGSFAYTVQVRISPPAASNTGA
jgi:hypothetical protein